MSDFKVLILYPNGVLMNPPPISVGIFTALLKENGFKVDLFDTTLYPENKQGSDDAKKENLQVRPFDYGSRGVALKASNLEEDLIKKVKDFNPNLILISTLECTYERSLLMFKALESFDIPIMAGGVFPTFAPQIILKQKNVSIVCIGEGEDAVVEVCKRLRDGLDYQDINNLCFLKDGKLVVNPMRSPVDINKLPLPDYSLFEEYRFFRPMAGKVYRTVPIETNRGCPYTCSFCNSPSTFKLYRDNNCNYFRRKSLENIKRELDFLIKTWNAEYVYFTSDNFLVGNDTEFDKFIEIYKDIKLPFWMQCRPEAVNEDRMRKLKEVGCHRMSVGLEHGNDDFRKNVLKKKFDNDTMIKASRIIADVGIPLTVNNMIGFPDETRELIFDTIELNRKLTFDSSNCSVFSPFHGTPLQKLCVEKGYISDDFIFGSVNVDAPLDMPQLSREDIKGIRRTFAMYAKMPKEYWPKIAKAERFDEEGDKCFKELSRIYQEMYFK